MSDNTREEIYTGQFSYTLFKLSGVWEPFEYKSKWKSIIYRIYSICSLILFTIFTGSVFLSILGKHENIEALLQSVFYFITFFTTLLKLIIITKKRKIFVKTQKMFLSESCRPRDSQENEILHNCSQRGRCIIIQKFGNINIIICIFFMKLNNFYYFYRRNSIYFYLMVHITGTFIMLSPLATIPNMNLPVPYWTPFSLDSKLVYFLIYLHQVFGCFITIFINVGMDTLVLTVIIRICGQLEIIMHRLYSLSQLIKSNVLESIDYNQQMEIINCAKHHLHIKL